MNIARVAAVLAIAIVPSLAMAGPRDDLIAGMAKCAALADNTARLACYDGLNPVVKAAQAEPPPAATTPPAEPADNRAWYDPGRIFGVSPREQTTPQQFGGENLPPPPLPPGVKPTPENTPPPALDSITAGVSEYSFTPYQKFIIILDNGQIWEQLQSDDGIAHFMKNEKNSVTITRAFLDSYLLVLNDGASYKVKRLK